LLNRLMPPTAILYSNDLMAMAGLAVANRRGIAVPRDLSIVGYDDAELAAHLHPALSTVRTDAYGWGRAAATTLLELLDGQQPADVHLAPARFIVRDSTGPVAGVRKSATQQGVSQ
jgi:LacI family repressor for deo operon, udp, cdd, tsx, nupC, and nupG